MTSTPESPTEKDPNTYEVAPEHSGTKQGYDVSEPNQADEGYTADGVLKHHGQQSKWGRPEHEQQ